VTSYAAAAIVVTILIGWIMFDYRNQTARLRELDRSGITRRSGRSATDTPRTIT
jgi:heme exporter protein D